MNSTSEIDTSYAPASPDLQEEELDLDHVLSVLAESKWLILLVSLLVFLASGAYIWIAAPEYEANALIQVEKQQNSTDEALRDILSPLSMGETAFSTQIGILKSRLVLGKVVDSLRLFISASPVYFPVIGPSLARRHDPTEGLAEPWFGWRQYAWGGASIQVETFDVPTAYMDKRFIVEAAEGGGYRLLGPETPSGDTPVILEGEVGKPAQTELDGEPLTLFVSELKARPGARFNLVHYNRFGIIDGLSTALQIAEEGKDSGLIRIKLQSPNPAEASVIVNEIANIYLRQNVEHKSAEAAKTLSFLEQQLPILKKDMEASEATLNAYRLKQGSIDLPKEVDIILTRIVATEGQLLQLKQQREPLLQKFTPAHPTMVALDAQMARLDKELNELNKQIKNLPSAQQQIITMNRNLEVNTALYTALLNKAQELQIAKAGTLGNVRIIDYAFIPFQPISPKKGLILPLSLVLGVFLGIFIAFLRRSLWQGVEDPDQLEKQLGLPVYTNILHSRQQDKLSRRMSTDSRQPVLLASSAPEDLAVEGLRSLRTTLHFVLLDTKNNLIAITGTSPGVGKTFITANLGAILASVGKRVLLIDADLRKGQLHKYLGESREPGLSDIIGGTITLEQAIRHTAIDGLDLLATGTLPPNPSELLVHERFALCLDEVNTIYDHILIDCPPVLAVTDAAIVGRLAGTSLLVVKAGVNVMREVEQSIKRLKQAGVNPRGLLLNNVKLASRHYGYSRYYKYAYQYSYKK